MACSSADISEIPIFPTRPFIDVVSALCKDFGTKKDTDTAAMILVTASCIIVHKLHQILETACKRLAGIG